MYRIAVEARLTGPAAGMEAAWQILADYATNTPEQLRPNGAYSCVEHALKEVVLNGGKGSVEATARNVNGATMEVDNTLSKKELTPLASFAQDLLAATGCTLDVAITQVYGSGPYTVSHVVMHTIHPSTEKRHRTLKVSVLTPPTLGLEG